MGRSIKGIQVVDIEKRREPAKHYVYVIFVTWSDGCSFVIYRRYSRFFDLQSKLLDKFPIEAGSVEPEQRKIPFLPGKIIFGRSHIREVALKRMEPINEYCKKIIALPDKISQCEEVLSFFEVDADDLDPPALSNKLKDQQSAEKISKPKQLEQFVVVCDYEPESKGEISLQAGMKVEVIEKSDSGWWFVNAEDEQGWVPSTYLEPVSGTKDNTVLRAKPGEEEKFICIADFAPNAESGPDEIPLSKGAMVEVIEKNLDGWWVVRYGGRQGVAPATYLLKAKDVQAQHLAEQSRNSGVEIIPSLSSISNIIPRTSSNASDTTDGPKSPSGNDALNRAIKKRTLERAGSLKPPPRQNSIPAASPDDVPVPTTPKSHYATLADFSAQMDDGISFSAGEEVQVMEKTSTGWWFVQIGDKEGWAPASYIEKKAFSTEETTEKQASAPTPSLITTAAPASISVKRPPAPAASKPVEQDDDFSGSDGFEDSDDDMPRKPVAVALASALRSQMEKKPLPPMPPSKSAASAPKPSPPAPSTPATKPGPPGKPLMPPKVSAERKGSSPVERVEDTPAPTPPSSQENGSGDGERRASGAAPGGNFLSQLQSRLQSGNKNRWSEADKGDKEADSKSPTRPAPSISSSAALFSPKPFKPQLPKKVLPPTPAAPQSTDDSASSSAASSAPARPSLPKKPPLAEKPKLAQKPSLPLKPRPPSKALTKTVSLSGKDTPKDTTPAGPPKLPSQPPKIPSQPSKQPDQPPKLPSQPPKLPSKPAAASKPKPDTNNNKGNDSEKNCTAPGGVQGLAAALKSKMESSGTPRPQLPTKAPSSTSSMGNGSVEVSSSKTSSSGSSPSDSAADVPKANVGSLVSALSGKLSFGGPPPEASGSRNSAAARDLSPVHTPTPEPVSTVISQTKASSKSSSTSSSVEKYTVVADFSGETDTEISLYEGDTVEVLERCNEDWWLVKVGGVEGYAPTSYLEPCTSAPQPKSTASSQSSSRVSATSSSLAATAARYTTCAAFVAEHDGELGFEEGAILDDILDKTDSDWWLISYGGQEGWAPASYIVETVPPRVESLSASANLSRQW